ncbi:MAG: radical SAM protein [Candidatus Woesearchaeota archaeon]
MNRLKYKGLELLGILSGNRAFAGPEWVQIDLTNMCNNNCIGCWCNSPLLGEKGMSALAKQQKLSFHVVKKLIDDLRSLGTRRIFLCGGGEPLVHPKIREVISYIKENRIVCALNTNFTLVNKELAKWLVDIGLDEITISLWASNPKTYSETHPNKTGNDFVKIRETIKFMQDYKTKKSKEKPVVKLYNVIFNLNYKDIKSMISFAESVNAEMIEFAPLDPIPKKTEVLLLNENQRKELLSEVKEIVREKQAGRCKKTEVLIETFYERIKNKKSTRGIYDDVVVKELPCYVGWVFARIMADGSVVPCLKAHRMPIGNIYKKSFKKIWNSKKYNNFRRMAVLFNKKNPFFKNIGNNPSGCFSSCDNIADNMSINNNLIVKVIRGKIFEMKNKKNKK